eukprot:393220-Amphidinium_carterae.1
MPVTPQTLQCSAFRQVLEGEHMSPCNSTKSFKAPKSKGSWPGPREKTKYFGLQGRATSKTVKDSQASSHLCQCGGVWLDQ